VSPFLKIHFRKWALFRDDVSDCRKQKISLSQLVRHCDKETDDVPVRIERSSTKQKQQTRRLVACKRHCAVRAFRFCYKPGEGAKEKTKGFPSREQFQRTRELFGECGNIFDEATLPSLKGLFSGDDIRTGNSNRTSRGENLCVCGLFSPTLLLIQSTNHIAYERACWKSFCCGFVV
jgi:hypothetical protein